MFVLLQVAFGKPVEDQFTHRVLSPLTWVKVEVPTRFLMLVGWPTKFLFNSSVLRNCFKTCYKRLAIILIMAIYTML